MPTDRVTRATIAREWSCYTMDERRERYIGALLEWQGVLDERDELRRRIRALVDAHDSGRSYRDELAALREVTAPGAPFPLRVIGQ